MRTKSTQHEHPPDIPGSHGIATWHWNIDTDSVFYSTEWKSLRGLNGVNITDTQGESLRRVHLEDVEALKLQRKRLSSGECDFYEHDHRVLHEDGSWLWIAERAIAEHDKDGKVIRLSACDVEITRRKEAELELQSCHQHRNTIVEGSSGGQVSYENLLSILEATTDFVSYANPQREILYRNRSAREALPSISAAEPYDFINTYAEWSQAKLLREAIPSAIKHGTWSGELALLDTHGKEIPASQVLIAHKEHDGTLQGFSTIIRDISELKKTETALRENERKFSTLAESAPVGIFQLDADLNLNYVNNYWLELVGRTTESSKGKGWMEAVHPDDHEPLMEHATAFRNNLQQKTLSIHLRYLQPNGSTIWAQVSVSKLFNDNGTFTGVVGTVTDISKLKSTEQRLRQLNDRFQKVLETGSIGLWEFTGDKHTWDEQMFKIYGVSADDYKGTYKDWSGRLHPDDLERATSDLQVNASKELPTTEYRIVRPNGEIRHIYSSKYMVVNEKNSQVRAIGLNVDITERRNAELALQESELKFQRVAEHVPGLVYRFVLDDDSIGRLTYASSGVRDIFNVEPEELLEDIRKFWDRVHPDDRHKFSDEVIAASKKLVTTSHEFRIQVPGKGTRYVQVFSQPFLSDSGEVIWDGVLTDQTEHKTAQHALEGAQSIIAKTAENIPGMVYRYITYRDKPKRFLYVSSDSLEMFGSTPEEIMEDGTKLTQWMEPDDLQRLVGALKPAEKTLTAQHVECRVNTPNKGQLWYEFYCRPESLGDGKTLWDGVVLDITDRKLIELSLHDAQTQMQLLTENLPGVVFRYISHADGSNSVTYVSAQAREVFELEPEELLADANNSSKYIHPDDQEQFFHAIQVSRENIEPFNQECRAVLPVKGLRWIQTYGQPVRSENGDVTWDGISIDITARKQAELQQQRANNELAKATKLKDEFLANMSHELRTPLNAILCTNEGLQHGVYGSVTQEQLESFNIIEQSGAHLLTLINNVLDLAKIESGQLELELSTFNISKLCKDSLKFVSRQAESKNIQLNLNVSWNLPALQADEIRIRQVLINLLANAVKFTPEGGSVTLSARQKVNVSDDGNEVVQFCVSDTGIGIATDKLTTLFNPFVQIDSSLNRSYQGTGLGLSLVKRFVDLHHGHINVESKLGVGSRFIFELALLQGAEENHQSSAPIAPPTSTTNKTKARVSTDQKSATILLAEDNESVAKSVTAYLKTENFIVHLACNGADAVRDTERLLPDIVLMDIQLPGMDGLSAIRKLRENPAVKNTPIIALTGIAMPGDSERCLLAGADEYLSKPYRIAKLVPLINELLINRTNGTIEPDKRGEEETEEQLPV